MAEEILYAEERGAGVPLVLLHGFPFDHTLWDAQMAPLSEVARVLAPDLPGFGRSAPLGGGAPTMDAYADAVVAWADGLGLDRFILVGHSMGGYVAFAVLRRHSARVRGLGLVCTRAGADSEQARANREQQSTGVRERGAVVVAEAMLPGLLAPGAAQEHPAMVDHVRRLMLGQPPAGIIAALAAMATRPDSTPLPPAITVPTVVVAGADDRIISRPDVDLLAARIRGARQVIIPGAGHLPMLEQPEKLTAALRDLAGGASTSKASPEPA